METYTVVAVLVPTAMNAPAVKAISARATLLSVREQQHENSSIVSQSAENRSSQDAHPAEDSHWEPYAKSRKSLALNLSAIHRELPLKLNRLCLAGFSGFQSRERSRGRGDLAVWRDLLAADTVV